MSPRIIAIHYGHNATVALLQDGAITDCISEERLNRLKNSTGFPTQALAYIEKRLGGKADYYVFAGETTAGYAYLKKKGFTSHSYGWYWRDMVKPQESLLWKLRKKFARQSAPSISIAEMRTGFARLTGVEESKILFVNHHLAHALSTRFFTPDTKRDTLVFTLDAEGDDVCATVSTVKAHEHEVLSRVKKDHSLGYLYTWVTAFLGMKSNEHEFKVMGLAPYAKQEWVEKILPFFRNLVILDEKNEFHARLPLTDLRDELERNLLGYRFDTVAGALQTFTEEIVCEWVGRWIAQTGLRHVAVAGGVFMNVKLNQRIAAMPEVESFVVTPSAGDESLVFGSAYWGLLHHNKALGTEVIAESTTSLNLGSNHSDEEIEKFLTNEGVVSRYNVCKPADMPATIARLLAENKVVARFAGRMEFGARALGNRSILANPAQFDTVRLINEMIKNRDFWMPFASSIMEEDADRYLINPKKIDGLYMAITFDTTPLALEHLSAALHPYDKTCRAQIVKQSANPSYHAIISEFKKLTGRGAILNTSFNLHGEPNVESPHDALHTLEDSGLQYLAMGPFLIEKRK